MEKKKKKFGLKVIITLFIIVFLVLYLYIYVFPSISNKFKDTYKIEYGTVSLGEDAQFLIFRDEAILNATNSGNVTRIISDGELVRANTEVCKIDGTTYKNSKRGFVSYYYDGFEKVYSLDMLDTLKSTTVNEINASSVDSEGKSIELVKECCNSNISYGEPLYKMIYSNKWYICTWVSKATALDVRIGGKVSLVIEDTTIAMDVDDIIEQGTEIELILSSTNYFEDFDKIRTGDARIITKSSTGLIIETDSIVTLDGVDGVYVINSVGKTSFVPIKIILKTEDKTIVSRNYFYDANGNYTYTVKIYDTVLRRK